MTGKNSPTRCELASPLTIISCSLMQMFSFGSDNGSQGPAPQPAEGALARVRFLFAWSPANPVKEFEKPLESTFMASDLRFECPSCGQHLAVEETAAGMRFNCRSCNQRIEIPRSATPPPPPVALVPAVKQTSSCLATFFQRFSFQLLI